MGKATIVDIGKYAYEITRFWGSGANGDWQAMIVGIASGERVAGDIVIPDSVSYDGKTYPVVGIGEGDYSGILEGVDPAFYMNDQITSVTISKNIRFIASNEFIGCHNIEKYIVDEENSHFISENGLLYELNYSYDQKKDLYDLFRYPSARKNSTFTLPSKAISVSAGAFAANDHLRIIIISGEQNLDSRWQLGNKTIENVDCKSSSVYTQPEDGVLLYHNTFKGVCPALKRTSYTLPSNVRYVSEGAFCESEIKEITFPENISTPLSQYEFLNSAVEKINFQCKLPSSVPQGCFINASSLSTISLQGDEKGHIIFYSSAFFGCKSLESISLAENIKTLKIESNAFQNCRSLKEFPLTSKMKVTELKSYAFSGCTSLTAFSLGCVNEIENVPGYQFEGSGLTYVNWPSTFSKVPYGCFKDCKDLAKINLKMTTTDICSDAFAGSGLTAISMMGVEWYSYTAFYDCQNLSRVYFPINERSSVNYRNIDFIPTTCEVIVNNPSIKGLNYQDPSETSEVKLYMSSFTYDSEIGNGWDAVYVPGQATETYSIHTDSEVREMFKYVTDKDNSRVKITSLAAGVRITGVTIEGETAELQDGWWQASCDPSEGIRMNVVVNYTVYGNPMTTSYEYQFESILTETINIDAEEAIEVEITNSLIKLNSCVAWEIYDLSGHLLMKDQSNYIDIAPLFKGVYILKIPSHPAATTKFLR